MASAIHTAVLGQFDARSIHTCRRHLTFRWRDTDLHLIVLIQRIAGGNSVAIMGDVCGTRFALADRQRKIFYLYIVSNDRVSEIDFDQNDHDQMTTFD